MSDEPIVVAIERVERTTFLVSRDTWGQFVHELDADIDPDVMADVMILADAMGELESEELVTAIESMGLRSPIMSTENGPVRIRSVINPHRKAKS